MTRKWIVIVCSLFCLMLPAAAQTSGGQVCVLAFEDRNGDGEPAANEPRITRGISITLADEQGIIIASGLMEDSPTSASGNYCFQRLEAGQYRLRIASADYTPTTPTEFLTAVTGTDVQVFEYGGQLIPVSTTTTTTSGETDLTLSEAEQRSLLTRLLISGGGALLVMAAMGVIGAILYFVFGRRSPAPAAAYSTGSMPPVSTGAMPPVGGSLGYGAPPPATNRPQAPAADGTDIPQRPPARPDAPDDDFAFDDFDNDQD